MITSLLKLRLAATRSEVQSRSGGTKDPGRTGDPSLHRGAKLPFLSRPLLPLPVDRLFALLGANLVVPLGRDEVLLAIRADRPAFLGLP